MYLGSKKPSRLASSASSKTRLNTHAHKLEAVETPRKKSPDANNPGPTSPSEVLVFNTHHGGTATRAGHYNKSLPQVPNYEEIRRFMQDSWDERIARINDPNSKLTVLWVKSFAEEELEREQAAKQATSTTPNEINEPGISPSSSPITSLTVSVANLQFNHKPQVSISGTASTAPITSSSGSASASSSSASTPTSAGSLTNQNQKPSKNYNNNSPHHNNKRGNRH